MKLNEQSILFDSPMTSNGAKQSTWKKFLRSQSVSTTTPFGCPCNGRRIIDTATSKSDNCNVSCDQLHLEKSNELCHGDCLGSKNCNCELHIRSKDHGGCSLKSREYRLLGKKRSASMDTLDKIALPPWRVSPTYKRKHGKSCRSLSLPDNAGENATDTNDKEALVQGEKDRVHDNKDIVHGNKDIVHGNKDRVHRNKDRVHGNKDIVGEKKDLIGDTKDLIGNTKDLIGDKKDVIGDKKDLIGDKKDKRHINKNITGEKKDRRYVNKSRAGEKKDRRHGDVTIRGDMKKNVRHGDSIVGGDMKEKQDTDKEGSNSSDTSMDHMDCDSHQPSSPESNASSSEQRPSSSNHSVHSSPHHSPKHRSTETSQEKEDSTGRSKDNEELDVDLSMETTKPLPFSSTNSGDEISQSLESLLLKDEPFSQLDRSSSEEHCETCEKKELLEVDSYDNISGRMTRRTIRYEIKEISDVASELLESRKRDEEEALRWSVDMATKRGVISKQLQSALFKVIDKGVLGEVRDVLYHKCHLVAAVQPVSMEEPSEHEESADNTLNDLLEQMSPQESTEERHQKLTVLQYLNSIITDWVAEVGRYRGLSEERIAVAGGTLFVAGSYRLGLHDPNSDIDAVCVVPWHVTREDFFESLHQILLRIPAVSRLATVPHAFVPLMTLVYHGVPIDLLFARLPVPCVFPDHDIDSDHILAGMDVASAKSLNAPRVSTLLLSLVPNRKIFRTVLRTVRLWARRRGIYSNKMGYLGGVNWALLVGFVCLLYPKAVVSTLVQRFFQVMSEWHWPQPVILSLVYDAGLGFDIWDPLVNHYDRAHWMPIITPAYPSMNSAVHVSQATLSVMYEEFWRARALADVAMEGKGAWDALFFPSEFFLRYNLYLAVDFSATTVQDMYTWGKYVESRLRKLVESLQHTPVARVHPFPERFQSTSTGVLPGACLFIGLELQHKVEGVHDDRMENLSAAIRFFLATDLQQWNDRSDGMLASTRLLSWDDLPDFVFPDGREVAMTERINYQHLQQMQQNSFFYPSSFQ